LSAQVRLAVQFAAGLGFLVALTGVPASTAAAVLLLLATVAIAWASNLFNFMDGIDGIAGMEALFICTVAGALVWRHNASFAALLWVVAAAAAGFLIWNWAPARIFMGDVGSGFLGFLIAAIAALTIARGQLALPVWLILWALFLADTAVTLVRRIVRRERWWAAHRSHAYQRLATHLGSHAQVTLIYAALNLIVIMPSAWYAHTHGSLAWAICAAIFAGSAWLAHRRSA
jgi:Fuc2NAc and GlcNAc transferase